MKVSDCCEAEVVKLSGKFYCTECNKICKPVKAETIIEFEPDFELD